MNLLYIANARIPSEKAHPYQILKMCEAFKARGAEVTLVTPFRVQPRAMKEIVDIGSHYSIKERFNIVRLPSLDLIWLNKYLPLLDYLFFYIQALSFALFSLIYVIPKKADIVYSRDELCLFLLSFIKKNTYFELHSLPKRGRWFYVQLLSRFSGIISITDRLKELCIYAGIPGEKIIVAPDGVDLDKFGATIPKENARKELGIPLNKKIVCYTGHLYNWKGVYVLADCMKYLPSDCILYIVGGTDEDLIKFQSYVKEGNISNIVIVGYVKPSLVPKYLAAADAVVLPNMEGGLSEYTSPLKLFEYMASRRPIVASDLTSIREILNNENAVLVKPDNSKSLAEGIKKVLKGNNKKIVENAYKDVQAHTWGKRAKKILGFMGGNNVS